MSLLGQILGTVSGGKTSKVSEQLLFDKVIGFRGVFDGVGTSTLVFNTACALSDVSNMNICVVDTHILYPVLSHYFGGAAEKGTKDWFDFNVDGSNISDIAYTTRFSNVYLVSLYRRGLPELLSNYDNERIVTALFDTLTKFFDVVLVDLSHEPTYLSALSAVRCNKIYTIFEPSLGCMTNLKASVNTLVELGIPPYKLSKVILNKHIEDVNNGYQNILNKYQFKLVAAIPFSVDIARNSVIGNKVWGVASNKTAITRFNMAMDNILDDILQNNTQAQGYLKDESEFTEIEDKTQKPLRVDGEPFDYVEPAGKPMKITKKRPQGVQPRGLAKGISAETNPIQRGNMQNNMVMQGGQQGNMGMQGGQQGNMGMQGGQQANMGMQGGQQANMQNNIGMQGGQQANTQNNRGMQGGQQGSIQNNAFVPMGGGEFAPNQSAQNNAFVPMNNGFAPTENNSFTQQTGGQSQNMGQAQQKRQRNPFSGMTGGSNNA